jgi:hypothetical protein
MVNGSIQLPGHYHYNGNIDHSAGGHHDFSRIIQCINNIVNDI